MSANIYRVGLQDRQWTVYWPALAVLACGVLLFLVRAWAGLTLVEFGDEAEKFVVARMIDQGRHLYREIFSHHGPIPYMIAHAYASVVSATDFSFARAAMVLLAAAAGWAVAFSPVLKSFAAKAWATALFLSVLSSVWVLQSIHMVMYQPIGGFLFVIALAQMGVPALLGEKISRAGLFVSGFALTTACFAAYSFGPAAVFVAAATALALAAAKEKLKTYLAPFFLGVIAAAGLVVLWMALFGDLVGFLVYHFYMNQKVYAVFNGFSLQSVLNNFNLSPAPHHLVHTMAVFFLVMWACLLVYLVVHRNRNIKVLAFRVVSLLLFAAAVVYLNPRGVIGFHGAGFVVVNMAMSALAAAMLLEGVLKAFAGWRGVQAVVGFALIFAMAEYVANHAVSSPHRIPKKAFAAHPASPKPQDTGIFGFIRSVTAEKEQILSLIYNPGFYLKADRMPASGHFFYLPWQAAYSQVHLWDYHIDICADITAQKPVFIRFDDWKVWQRYEIENYEPCVPALIREHYTRIHSHFFVRNDRARDMMIREPRGQYETRPSAPLTPNRPIELRMAGDRSALLKRIGVRFGTYRRVNPGDAELRLRDPEGMTVKQQFSLAVLTDNHYRYFDIDPGRYTAGEIVFATGGGVSTWESHGAQGGVNTCLIYEYDNGTIAYTPGCPPY